MEVAVIDWKDSVFVKDDNLEKINAPQWVDFFAPDVSVDDEAWFCKPDCNHPKTVEDFLKTPNPKIQRSVSVSEALPFGDRNQREAAALKKRTQNQPSMTLYDKLIDDGENQNPNLSTPLKHKARLLKEAIKSSTEKKKQVDHLSNKEETPKLKSTLSARNLFAGRDILGHITDFCTELKRLALRAKQRENVEKESVEKETVRKSPGKNAEVKEDSESNTPTVLDEKKPLLEVVSKEKVQVMEKSNGKAKLRTKRRNDEAENTPIRVDLKNIGRKEEILSQIRTNPPTPQCFSAQRGVTKATTPNIFKARPQERGILQEIEQSNKDVRKAYDGADKAANERLVPIPTEREAPRSLDVFWFLKPCQLST